MKFIYIISYSLIISSCLKIDENKKTLYNLIEFYEIEKLVNDYGEKIVLDSLCSYQNQDTLSSTELFWYSYSNFDSTWYLRNFNGLGNIASYNLEVVFCTKMIYDKQLSNNQNDTFMYALYDKTKEQIIYDFEYNLKSKCYTKNESKEIVDIISNFCNWKNIYKTKGIDYLRKNNIKPIIDKYDFRLIKRGLTYDFR